jgi:hypothetical protein
MITNSELILCVGVSFLGVPIVVTGRGGQNEISDSGWWSVARVSKHLSHNPFVCRLLHKCYVLASTNHAVL